MHAPLASESTSATTTQRAVGAQMARLRESFNLTLQEVSERLHIRARYINAMEEGRYELMPGKVYARGYVHTYAEFLGLNPEKIVADCFAGEPPSVAQPVSAPPRTVPSATAMVTGHWRGYAVVAAVGLVAMLIVSQLAGAFKSSEPEVTHVAPVPEAMLASVRNLVMPTPMNFTCLTSDSRLGCFYSDSASRKLASLMDTRQMLFLGDIDISDMIQMPAEEPEMRAVPRTVEREVPAATITKEPVVEPAPAVAAEMPAVTTPVVVEDAPLLSPEAGAAAPMVDDGFIDVVPELGGVHD